MSEESQKRLIALLLGVTTILAGLFTWRAGQLGSAAAFNDRQAIGQTIKQEAQNVQVGVGGALDGAEYVRYVADYAEANAVDNDAETLAALEEDDIALIRTRQAADLRRAATIRAASNGVSRLC